MQLLGESVVLGCRGKIEAGIEQVGEGTFVHSVQVGVQWVKGLDAHNTEDAIPNKCEAHRRPLDMLSSRDRDHLLNVTILASSGIQSLNLSPPREGTRDFSFLPRSGIDGRTT